MDTSSPYTLSPEFWAEFVERHWERAPRVLERPFAQPIASPEDVFGAVVDASRAAREVRLQRHATRVPRVRFFVDGAALMSDLDEHLPDERDGHPDRYFDRVAALLEDRPFELVVNELQEHSFTLWSRLRSFLRGLYRHVGLPAARADAVAFLRRQERTSFGVHRDDASVFMFVLAGTKRVLTWPESSMRGREHVLMTREYHRFRDEAIVLEGQPGDVLYWPSSHWHIGEGDGRPSVSLNLSLIQWPPSMDVLRQLS
ncbi:MAG: hypothetical protein KDK70_43270, partial [Myxococcales bacterium]|nr:hypothetical protein [Myxococcales bacterium]